MEAPGSILQVACWGSGDQGRLGLGSDKSSAVPRLLGALKDACFTGVSSGGAHTAAVAVDGTAFLWGLNDRGQLAQGTESPFLQVQSSHHVPHMHDVGPLLCLALLQLSMEAVAKLCTVCNMPAA